jgi:hypothetical protein
MTIKPLQVTVDSTTRVKVCPTAAIVRGGTLWLKSDSGTARIYADATASDYVTFSDTDAIGPFDVEPGDEFWVLADSTNVDIQILEVGVT